MWLRIFRYLGLSLIFFVIFLMVFLEIFLRILFVLIFFVIFKLNLYIFCRNDFKFFLLNVDILGFVWIERELVIILRWLV